MGGKSANDSGMVQAQAAADAANKAYALGEEQLQWSKDVWNQNQPLMTQTEQAQLALYTQQADSLAEADKRSAQQYANWVDTYQPLEKQYVAAVQGWDSPAAIATARGKAMSDVAEAGTSGMNSAAEKLRDYGVNPGAPKYQSLYAGVQPMLSAAEAAAGTTAAQQLHEQKMQLQAGAINTGRGVVDSSGNLMSTGTQAGQAGSGAAAAAANIANANLNTGSTAMTAPTQWFNAGANNMNTYVGAVNGYNDAQAKMDQISAQEMSGVGSILGAIPGLMKVAKGGPIGYEDGGGVDPTLTPQQGGGATGIPSPPVIPPQGIPTRYALGATTGGTVPVHASPSGGAAVDDVPAMLTAHEFVIPKDVAMWMGHKALAGTIDKARKEQQQFAGRDDIGGEPTMAIPQAPTFVSRRIG